jgi:hypothetical protein
MFPRTALLGLLFVLACTGGCKSTTVPLREQGELHGKVYVLGNDPFTKLALAIDEQKSVVLLCTPEVDKYLRSHQGAMAKVTYDGTSTVPEGQAVRVTGAEMAKE